MAVEEIKDPNDPNNKEAQQAPAMTPMANEAGTAPVGQPAAPQGQPSQVVQQPAGGSRTGSGFVNIQRTLAANRANRMGQAIQSGVGNIAGQARSGLQQAQQQFLQKSQEGQLGTESDVAKKQSVLSRIQGYQAPENPQVGTFGFREGQPPQQPAQEPNLLSAEDIEAFKRFQSGQYTGPSGLENADKLQEQAIKSQALGSLAGSTGGRQELLRQFVARKPGYSAGKSALDAAILGQTGGSQLSQAKRETLGLAPAVERASTAAQEFAKTQQGKAQKFGEDVRSELGTGISGISTDLQSRLSKENTEAQGAYQDLQRRLTNKQLTTEDVNRYLQPLLTSGQLTADTSLFGKTPEELASAFSQGQYSIENVMDPTTRRKLDALQTLAGRQDVTYDPSKIGSMVQDINTDPSQFADIIQRQTRYGQEINPYQQLLAQTQARNEALGSILTPLEAELAKAKTISEMGQVTYNRDQVIGTLNQALQNPALANRPDIRAVLEQELNQWSTNTGDAKTPYERDLENQRNSGGVVTARPTTFVGQDIRQMLGYNQAGANVERIKSRLGEVQGKYGATGTILDLMSPEAKQQYLASNPSLLQQAQQSPMEQAKYNEMLKQYFPDVATSDFTPTNDLNNLYSGVTGLYGQGLGGTTGAVKGAVDWVGARLSDKNLKTNIESGDKRVQGFLDKLKPYQYDYINPEHGEGKQLSVMAQDLEKSDLGKVGVEELPVGKAVNYGKLAGVMLAAQSQLNDRIKRLEQNKKKK